MIFRNEKGEIGFSLSWRRLKSAKSKHLKNKKGATETPKKNLTVVQSKS
jgi:hypothetical protein